MEKAELECYILGNYPGLINELKKLINLSISKVKVISITNKDWIVKDDARYATYGKFVSNLNATRISLFNTLNFIEQKDWAEILNSELSIEGHPNNLVYIIELDEQLRYASYMGFVSIFESSLLIIIRFLKETGLKCSDKYANFITDNLNIKSHSAFLRIVKHLRNSIHNNGIHIPDNSKYDNDNIIFKDFDFTFQRNKRVELIWTDCFDIYEELINLTEQIFKLDLLEKHEIIKDIVVDS